MKIIWSQTAAQDLQLIIHFLGDIPETAIKFCDRISARVNALLESPYLGKEGRVTGTFEVTIRRTLMINSLFVYTITDESINILGICKCDLYSLSDEDD